MNENGFDFDDNDFGDLCGLADIFPDIEPYLEDVTNSYEIAKGDVIKKKLDGHIDGSDSDSGISADSYANSVIKTLDCSLSNSVFVQDNLSKPIKLTTTFIPKNKFISNLSETNKILVKRPISFISNLDSKQSIYNISPKASDDNCQKNTPIFIKSHSLIVNQNNKELPKSISKITPIKLLKSNEGYPIIINDTDRKTSDKKPYCDLQTKTMKPDSTIQKKDNIFLKDELLNIDDDLSLTNIYESRDDAHMDITSDDFKSQDCQSYFELFNSSQGLSNKILQNSSMFNNISNCDGILDAHHYDRMVKKQERMIKNRQAASLSRQRKKEYVERLEHKVEQHKQENHYLQNQVNDVRERFCALEQENLLLKRDIQTWRERYYDLEKQKIKQGLITTQKTFVKNNEVNNKNSALKATAASTTILGIFIILTFNFNSLNSNISALYKSQNNKADIPIYQSNFPIQNSFLGKKILGSESRLGRTLFSIVDNTSVTDENLGNHICNNTSGLNMSETLRLTRELNRWGSRFKAESVKVYDRLQNEKIKSKILSKEIESMYKNTKLRDIPNTINKVKKRRDLDSGQLQIYPKNNDYGFFDSFINDIDRRPDTLYFVTFHSDNLIFPASNMNKNLSTPKITLFLPADINQEDKNYYKMMKIDCQVQNFTIVNLRKIKVP